MTHDPPDAETLAALLDGKLSQAEREQVLERLAADPEAYASFLSAARVTAAVNDASDRQASPAFAIPAPARRRWRRLGVAGPFLAAAGIAGAVFLARSPGPSDTVAFVQSVHLPSTRGDGSVSKTLGADWDQPGWAVARGGEPQGAGTNVAARLGVRQAQLEYAATAQDSAAAGQVAQSLGALLGRVEGAAPLVPSLAGFVSMAPGERGAFARDLRTITRAPAAFDAGLWLETARLASLNSREELLAPDGQALEALRPILAALKATPPAGWAPVIAYLEVLGSGTIRERAELRATVASAIAALPL